MNPSDSKDPRKLIVRDIGGFNIRVMPGCTSCERAVERKDSMIPPHILMANCESGGHTHCTCGVCF